MHESHLIRHKAFHSEFLDQDRDVLVWLPPGYMGVRHEGSSTEVPHDGSSTEVPHDGSVTGVPTRTLVGNPRSGTFAGNPRWEPASGTIVGKLRYPVLYMHDGQNLFEPETAYKKGEHWRLGETAAGLIRAGRIEPLIIVGIYNTGEQRIHEYTPTRDAKLGGGRAADYGRMIVEELKPMIDRSYSTRPEAEHTGLGGSSLGGLVTLHLGFTHPKVFGKLAVLSPSVWWNRRTILRTVRQSRSKPRTKIWLDMGTAEGRRGLDDARLLKAALVGLGFAIGDDLHYAEYEGATHSEEAWAERVAPMLEWLYSARSSQPA